MSKQTILAWMLPILAFCGPVAAQTLPAEAFTGEESAPANRTALLTPPVAALDEGGADTPANAAATVEVPVLLRLVKAGTVLTGDDVALQAIPANRVYAGTARSLDEVVGKQLARTLEAGRTIARMQVKEPAAVVRDSAVTLTFRKPGLALVSQAKALQEGRTGESIRVLNVETRTTLLATVTGPGAVEIQ